MPRFPVCLVLSLLLCLAVSIFPGIGAAQMTEKTSNEEDVAIAFFKTSGTNPDFEKWAKGHKDYARQSVVEAPDFVYREEQRLMKLFRKYNPQEDVLTIGTTVTVNLKAVNEKDGSESFWMYLNFTDEAVTYFPFKFQDYKIAVIPQKIDTLLIQPLQKEQYLMMRADFKDKSVGPAKMYLGLKPVKAYVHQPYKIDNNDQWALLTDIATMALHSANTGSSMWYYTADWYVSPKADILRGIYQRGQTVRNAPDPTLEPPPTKSGIPEYAPTGQ